MVVQNADHAGYNRVAHANMIEVEPQAIHRLVHGLAIISIRTGNSLKQERDEQQNLCTH